MQVHRSAITAGLAALLGIAPNAATAGEAWIVQPQWVAAHEAFLASDALQGRGSATRDEAIAAAYVASQFQGYGLTPAPGLSGYLQTATIIKPRLTGRPSLTVGGAPVATFTLLEASTQSVQGRLTVAAGDKPDEFTAADVALSTAAASVALAVRSAWLKHVKLLILRDSDQTQRVFKGFGRETSISAYLEGAPPLPGPAVVAVPGPAFDQLAAQAGAEVELTLPPLALERSLTTNAIGYLRGTDPKAGVLLLTAHLDHLGLRKDGTIMHGANDDASGTTAVLELAHALSAGSRPRRSVLFVAYGSEEIGEYGSLYFVAHPPVPLSDIVANIEFEMIGAQVPKFPQGELMMTGFQRSNLGAALKAHGALVCADPYPEQHYFERSDNYQMALAGVVAHTLSGFGATPTYHQPTDTYANLDLPYMTRAIQSLIAPVRWLADSDFQPQWSSGGRPSKSP